MQLIHHDDVAAAIAVAVNHQRAAPSGAYNLAGDGVLSLSEVGVALGARPMKVPRVAAVVTSELISRIPFVPSALEWLHAGRTSVVMDTSKARNQLGWRPNSRRPRRSQHWPTQSGEPGTKPRPVRPDQPRHRLLELSSQPDEQRLTGEWRDELDAERQAVRGPVQGQ